ncbi:MAG: hypothetical protein NTX84_03170 [Nitrospirae bacterium]|nr:hypothetical protein [Nitrospirota bacterium]
MTGEIDNEHYRRQDYIKQPEKGWPEVDALRSTLQRKFDKDIRRDNEIFNRPHGGQRLSRGKRIAYSIALLWGNG